VELFGRYLILNLLFSTSLAFVFLLKPRSGTKVQIPSLCANWLTAKLSGVSIHDFRTTIKACPLLRSLPRKRR
jgi:hypothetical protein